VRLVFKLALEGDGVSGRMGVKAIAKHLNERRIYTRTGGRWGVGAVHRILIRPTYIGRHEFNKRAKTKALKPVDQVIAVAVPPLIDQDTFDAVQAHLKSRNPKVAPPQVVGGPTMLTGICFCANCGGAMTIRTGKSGRYRYYTCSIAARQGETGCKGRSIPMERLDDLVTQHLEERLLDPVRLEEVLSVVLDRRQERAERRAAHATELRKKAAEADARLKRLYDAIESGVADIEDESLKERIAELRALKSQAQVDAERATIALDAVGAEITSAKLRTIRRRSAPTATRTRRRISPRSPSGARPAGRGSGWRSQDYGIAGQPASHLGRRRRRKIGGWRRAQLCSEVAELRGFEPLTSAEQAPSRDDDAAACEG
jgi:site-specific DNA recombinase